MSAAAPVLDPLIAEAKFRMRRRRVLIVLLALFACAGMLFLLFRPSGGPGTARVIHHVGNENELAHVNVPVDAAERHWRAWIKSSRSRTASGLTPGAQARLRRQVVALAHKTGVTVVRIRVWPRAHAVEVALATGAKPAEYLTHRVVPLLLLLGDHKYVKVVTGTGSRIIEQYDLSSGGLTTVTPRRLEGCVGEPFSPPCPAK